ncbi:SGNH/GDSL hydrolase family protein [Streptomyces sp. SBT349]|uniref:SGNH/GDSL hydrolase family protein n=1 Tax=Streptomyces sp. SBT349 TaxID=1580539 RepID=UPI00066EC121|nr:SGNH/GDSL hydrolase family protein [Streptomyces sp. SBT349]
MAPVPLVLLYGDSMLARLTKPRIDLLERGTGLPGSVVNCAAGGWDSADLAARAPALARCGPDLVVLSVGANDCAPWKRVPLPSFAAHVAAVGSAFAGARLVGFLPPRIREVDRPGLGRRRNATLDAYREALRDAVGPTRCLDVPRILAGLTGAAPLAEDGLHLTAASYDALIPELARLVTTGLTEGRDGS